MPIPRQDNKSWFRVCFDVLQSILVTLVILIPYGFLSYLIYILICIVLFPVTSYYISSNFGMRSWDTIKMQVYIDTVQKNHPFMFVVNKYKIRDNKKPSEIEFYPHRSTVPLTCVGSFCGARYKFSSLSGVLSELEDNGWKREVVYDFFQLLIEQSGATPGPEFFAITEKICSHKIHRTLETTLVLNPWAILSHTLLPRSEKVNMWEGTGKEEIASFDDLRWMAKRGSVIKPQNYQVLEAIETLDRTLGGGVWKFATASTDVGDTTSWQTVVKPEGDE